MRMIIDAHIGRYLGPYSNPLSYCSSKEYPFSQITPAMLRCMQLLVVFLQLFEYAKRVVEFVDFELLQCWGWLAKLM
jgi:hypothetical protein